MIAKERLSDAGFGSPEAAIQTLFWALREGNQGKARRCFAPNFGVFGLTVLDLSRLPALTVLGQSQVSTADNLWGNWEALWTRPGLFVWKHANLTAPVWREGPFPPPVVTAWSDNGVLSVVGALPAQPTVSTGGGFVTPLPTVPVGVAAPIVVGPWYWGGTPGTLSLPLT